MTRAPVLIVGGDSKIGQALAAHLQQCGDEVICTSRRRLTSAIHLDLAHADSWTPPANVNAAVFCAANTSLEACKANPEATWKVNVDGVVQVAEKLRTRGAFIVFLSSNAVFDGASPHPHPDHPPCPTTEYGRQKAAAERLLRQVDARLAIVRFAKILPPFVPLFAEWRAALRAGRIIEAISNRVIAPVPLAFAVSMLRRIMQRQCEGILQMSGERDVSYSQIGLWMVEEVGARARLVRPILATDDEPAHTTLNTERARAELRLAPPPVASTILKAFRTNPKR